MVLSSFSPAGNSQTTRERPMQVAFFYGFPSLVSGANGDVDRAAEVFARHSVVVLGDGVEFDTVVKTRHPQGVGLAENRRTRQIIDAVRQRDAAVRFFGYVSIGDTQALPIAEIHRRMRLWKSLGVQGIFLDEAGYDWRIVNRRRQNATIQYAHSMGLAVFMNAYFPKSLLSDHSDARRNPTEEPIALQDRDSILLESFPIRNGSYETTDEWRTRLAQALDVRSRYGVHVISLATARADQPIEEGQLEYACWNAWMFDLDGVAWGEPGLSADNNLPARSCAVLRNSPPKGRLETADLLGTSKLFFRQTNEGVVVLDVESKTVHLKKNSSGPSQSSLDAREGVGRENAFSR